MYDGTLYGQWQAIVTFQQLIVLSGPDGVVDMTPQAIAARTSIPFEIIKAGIDVLEKEDPYSRSPAEDGKRIERLDEHRPWGWKIVNYAYYRNLQDAETVREQNRIRQQRKRERDSHAESRNVTPVTESHAESRQAEAEAEGIKNGQQADRFPDFWKAYPRRIKKADAKRAWARKKLNAIADKILEHLSARVTSDEQWLAEGGKFIPYPASWLNGDGWDDEYVKVSAGRHYL